MFGRDQAEEGHELARRGKTADIARGGEHGCGDGDADAAQQTQGIEGRFHRPLAGERLNLRGELLEARGGGKNVVDVALENNLLGGKTEALLAEPTVVDFGPGVLSGVKAVDPQEKALQAIAGHLLQDGGVGAAADEITHGFMAGIGHPDGIEFAGAMQAGKHDGVAPVGFDVVAGTARDAGGRDEDTGVAGLGDLAMDAITAGAGFIAAAQFDAGLAELFDQGGKRFRCVGNDAVVAHFAVAGVVGESDGNGFLGKRRLSITLRGARNLRLPVVLEEGRQDVGSGVGS